MSHPLRWRSRDLQAHAEMSADPEVMRYIGDGQVLDRPELAPDGLCQ